MVPITNSIVNNVAFSPKFMHLLIGKIIVYCLLQVTHSTEQDEFVYPLIFMRVESGINCSSRMADQYQFFERKMFLQEIYGRLYFFYFLTHQLIFKLSFGSICS